MPRALITGITGQDGLYLGEFLAAKGYEVFGMVRGQSNPKIPTVEEYIPSIQLLEGDLRDLSSLIGVLETAQPDGRGRAASVARVVATQPDGSTAAIRLDTVGPQAVRIRGTPGRQAAALGRLRQRREGGSVIGPVTFVRNVDGWAPGLSS